MRCSAVEITEQYLAWVEATEPNVRAFITVAPDQARAARGGLWTSAWLQREPLAWGLWRACQSASRFACLAFACLPSADVQKRVRMLRVQMIFELEQARLCSICIFRYDAVNLGDGLPGHDTHSHCSKQWLHLSGKEVMRCQYLHAYAGHTVHSGAGDDCGGRACCAATFPPTTRLRWRG